MDKELAIMEPFFENPTCEYHIREVARLAKVNHMTARNYLNKFAKESLLDKKESKLYTSYSANIKNKKFLNLKLFYNLEKIRKSKIIEDLELVYDYPPIILFGSYATATNTIKSDVDLFVLTNIQKDISLEQYEKILKRKVSLHRFTEREFKNMRQKNPELINNICNGITLSGRLEVI